MNRPSPEIKVTDLQLAAFLLASDFPLLRTEGTSHRLVFVFGDVPENAIFAFYRGDDAISARRLFGAYRDLKGLSVQQFSGGKGALRTQSPGGGHRIGDER